jgi:hypothetical protein
MDEMKSMMEMMGFRRLRLKMEQKRTLYSSPLEYNIFRQISYPTTELTTPNSKF